ncbi:MAG TPA: peptide-N-glycosidase F-related protein [bacterium]|nr:peptide-N-glycosidase F-related protein [bacterium]HPS29852.1 peptide-N-glycosidase F-related protein [bacterium]
MIVKNLLAICLSILMVLVSCSEENEKTADDGVATDVDSPDTADQDPEQNDAEEDIDIIDDSDLISNPEFADSPYGTAFGDTAGDFTVPTDKGDWSFSENRKAAENYIFIIYRSTNSESIAIWKTDMIRMFENTPENTHYFFAVDGAIELCEEKIAIINETIKTALEISGRTAIKNKIHIVTKPLRVVDSWLKEWLTGNPDFFLGIDRFQKIRKAGSFHSWKTSSLDPVFEFVYKEAELYNYEYGLYELLDEKKEQTTVLKGIDGLPFEGDGWTQSLSFTVDFPAFKNTGKLYLDLSQICDDPATCEWDRIQQLFLCSDETDESCNVEIGRWITTYGRSGKWLTDITPLLPLFEKAGKYKFKFTVSGDQYVNYLNFVYIEDAQEAKPVKIISLFKGTVPFNETYNNYWTEIEIEIPESVEKVFISSYITGHGNGSEAANCAEFCPFESIFYVNGTSYEHDFNNAGTSRGCFDLVDEGAVPNQYGSWPFGRAGWCPGADVKLINMDITESVVKGQKNKFFYGAFLGGEVYVPEITDPSGYRAEIPLTSYVIYW